MKLIIQFVSGPALSRRSLVSGPGALSVRASAALCAGAQRSLCQGPALSRCSLCRALSPALSVSASALPALSVSGPGGVRVGAGALCVGGRRCLCRGLARPAHVSGPAPPPPLCPSAASPHPHLASARHLSGPAGPRAQPRIRLRELRSTCHPSRCAASAGPGSDPRATHPARRIPFFQEGENPKPYGLGD